MTFQPTPPLKCRWELNDLHMSHLNFEQIYPSVCRQNGLYDVSTGSCLEVQYFTARKWLMGCHQVLICMYCKNWSRVEEEHKIVGKLLCLFLVACPPLEKLLKLHYVPHHGHLNLSDMLQPVLLSFYEKLRRTWCIFPPPFTVTLNTHPPPSHYGSLSPPQALTLFTSLWSCTGAFGQEENKMSLELPCVTQDCCHFHWLSFWLMKGGCFWFLSLWLWRVMGSKGTPWRVVKGSA